MQFWLKMDNGPVPVTGAQIEQLRRQGMLSDHEPLISLNAGNSWHSYNEVMAYYGSESAPTTGSTRSRSKAPLIATIAGTVVFLGIAAYFVLFSGDSGPGPKSKPEPAFKPAGDPGKTDVKDSLLPTYEEVIATYPKNARLTTTNATIIGANENGIDIKAYPEKGQSIEIIFKGDNIKSLICEYGTKLTVAKRMKIKGVTYNAGDRLTVDANRKLIRIAPWKE